MSLGIATVTGRIATLTVVMALFAAAGCGGSPDGAAERADRGATTSTIGQVPEVVPPKLAERPLPDQESQSFGYAPDDAHGPRLSEMVAASDVIFVGTFKGYGEPAFLIDRDRPTLDSMRYTEMTFDVDAYYRNELSTGGTVAVKLQGGSARMPAELLELRRRAEVKEGLLKPWDRVPVEWKDQRVGSFGIEPESLFRKGEKVLVFADLSECEVRRQGLPPRYIPCMRPSFDRYGVFGLLPTVNGEWQGTGMFEMFTKDLPSIVAQWPKKD